MSAVIMLLTISEIVDWAVRALLAVGGVTGITSLLLVRAQKKRLVADTGKTDAEADSIVADASMKKTEREARILDMSERVLKQMSDRLDDANERINQLTNYVEILVQALRTTGANVPPMPTKMIMESHPAPDAS